MKVYLLIIDPQYDFCNPEGSLYVKGAEEDMKRLAEMIRKGKSFIDKIFVTLDQHSIIHISHPVFWKDKSGKNPEPFTVIIKDDIESGKWTTSNPNMKKRAFSYIDELEKKGKYRLCIWPPHCIIGSIGATIVFDINKAIQEWEIEKWTKTEIITKGENIWTEHYSAIKAEVVDPSDPKTDINYTLIESLKDADIIGIGGEALSHCVANTVKDIANCIGDENIQKLVLIEDATSPVKGFEQLAKDFINEMGSKGMKILNTVDFINYCKNSG